MMRNVLSWEEFQEKIKDMIEEADYDKIPTSCEYTDCYRFYKENKIYYVDVSCN